MPAGDLALSAGLDYSSFVSSSFFLWLERWKGTLIFLSAFGLSVSRFCAFISDDVLGRMPKVARALFALYITDSLLMVVIINCYHTHEDPRFV